MLDTYRKDAAERAALGIPPLPLTSAQTSDLVGLLRNPPEGEEATLVDLFINRVPAGVDDAAKIKAEFLAKVAKGEEACALISKGQGDGTLGHHAGRLQRQAADRPARLARMRRGGGQGPEAHAVDVRLFQRREGFGRPSAASTPNP